MTVEDPLNRSPMDRTRGIIEKALEDLDRVVIVLSHVAVEDLEPDVMRAVAYGGFEMASSVVDHLERILPHFPTGDDDASPAATAAAGAEPVEVLNGLLTSTRENLDEVLTAFVLALHEEDRLSQRERDAIAKSAVERLRRIVEGDLAPYAPRAAEPALTN